MKAQIKSIKNKLTQNSKQSYRALGRRSLAALLTLAMLLPVVPSSLAAGTGLLKPIQATPADIAQDVQVEIEGNMVRDPYNRKILTGYYELGLRVKTPAGKSFRTLSMTLEYDSAHFTPVDWSDNDTPVDMTTNITEHYQKDMRAWSIGGINDLDAFGGTPAIPDAPIDDPTAPNPQVDPNRAMMTFTVRANKATELKFDDMTTIAVVRFQVHDDPNYVDPTGQNLPEDFLGHFSLKKNGPGDFSLCYDDDGPGPNAPVVVDTMEALQGKMGANAKPLANAALDSDIDLSASDVNMAFDYMLWDDADERKSYEYYYVPGYEYDANDPTTYDQVTTTINGQLYTLHRPSIEGDAVLAVDPAKADGDPDKYSYLTNLVPNDPVLQAGNPTGRYENINFTLVSKPSAIPGMDRAGQMVPVVLLDWQDNKIGELVVPADGKDIRDMVNDYVSTYLIYHDTNLVNYGPDDLYDPNNPANTDSALDIVKSLERKYNYRGKYPYDGPQPDGTTANTVTDGENYPLTNKLDYVFFKRPMERKTTLTQKPDPTDPLYQTPDANNKTGIRHSQYIADLADWNTWEQKADTTGANPVPEYDTENPFAYGWTRCTRSDHENIWTTLGSDGELLDYTVDGNGVASVTYDGAYDFEFTDLSQGLDPNVRDNVYFKAIYEPGVDLQDRGTNYRMVQNPYYSKLNVGAAKYGGAYTATMLFERSTDEIILGDTISRIRGVARMREPVVRQDTTTDLMWEENAALGISHNLPNEGMDSAYLDKYNSTFTKVLIDNGEEFGVELTFSARQNKVDYYLNEAYGKNFVAGGARSESDRDRSARLEDMGVVDNYNYFVDGESDTSDNWYDAAYKDREGTRGFVLYGTLNQIMEQATKCYNEDITQTEFASYLSIDVFSDMNLRKPDGTPITTTDRTTYVRKLVDAAGAAQTAHLGSNDAYWDLEHDCAQLTWHQAQGFLNNASLNHPDSSSDNPGWCHLHADCAAANAGKPQTWADLITTAATSGDLAAAGVLIGELEGLAYLRKDASGTPFANVSEYIAALEAAVTALGTSPIPSWDAVQAQIIGNGHTAADGPDKYWWYDLATTVTSLPKGNWSDLLALAKDAATPVAVPGETSATAATRDAKLNQIETIFDDNTYATSPDTNWVAVTENLCADNNGSKFTTFSAFKTALTNALQAYAVTTDPNYTTTPDWFQVQYYILHNATAVPNSNATPPAEYATYWWHNGGERVVDLATLLKAADQANNGNPAPLNAVTTTLLNDTIYLRKDVKGTKFATADPDMTTELTDLKTKLKTLVAANGTSLTWEQVQYYIARGQLDDKTLVVDPEAAFYWWKGGGTGTVISFTATTENTKTTTNANIGKLIEAVFRHQNYGDPKAMADFATAADIFKFTRLVKSASSGAAALTDLTEYTSVSDLETDVLALINADNAANSITDTVTYPNSLTWHQVQDYWMDGAGTLRTDAAIKAGSNYWWYDKASDAANNPASPLVDAIEKYLAGTYNAAQLQGTNVITVPLLNNTYKIRKTTAGAAWGAAPPAANLNAAKASLLQLANYLKNNTTPYYNAATGKVDLSWAQIQYYFAGNARVLDTTTNAMTAIQNWGWTVEGGGGAKPYIPQGVAMTGYSLRPMMAPMLMAPRPQVTTEVSPDGLTETTTSTMRTWNEDTQSEDVEIMTVVVTRIVGETTTTIVTTTTITITTLDPETFQPITAVDTYTEVETVPNTSSTYTGEDDTTLTDPDNGDDGASDNTNTSGNTTTWPDEGVGPYDKTDTNNSTYSNKDDTTLTDPDKKDPNGAPSEANPDESSDNGTIVPNPDESSDNDTVGPDAPGGPSSSGSTYTKTPDTTPLTTTLATQKQEIPVANDLKIRYNKEENTHTPTATTAAGSSGSGEGALGDVVPEGGDTVVKASNWEKGISTLARALSATRLTAETGGQSIAQASWQELLTARRIPERAAEKASPGETTFVFLDSGQRWGPPLDPGGPPPSPFPDTLIACSGLNTAPIRRITHE